MRKFPKPEKVVTDTNVIISAGISNDGNPARIFELILSEQITNFTSKEILQEIRSVIRRPRIAKRLTLRDWEFIFSAFERNSFVIEPVVHHHIIQDDPDDNKFIDCAIAAGADFIVTGDSHLLQLRKFQKVTILSPKAFLERDSPRDALII